MYQYICETNKDVNAEVRLYREEQNAKDAVKSCYEDYVESGEYVPADKYAIQDAKKEFKDSDETAFTIRLEDDEILSCHIEETDFYDDMY